ncbi:mechanosensitive ion channel family protein [Ruminococcus sp.]|uniref:mechanosensitive ion channel family protein n=1 Tax=Ruminococcus sp. TaxID=41978 RepID=UPI00386655E9
MDNFDFISALNSFNEKYLPKILIFLIVLAVGTITVRFFLKLVKKLLNKSKIERTVVTFLFSILKVVLYIVIVMTALSTIGVNVSSIITTFAAAALAAGLALQESLGNVASGIVILVSKPFVAGDILEFEGVKGYVRSIRIFSTQIHTFDNKIVNIPNSRLTANNVTNCTGQTNRRIDLSYTVSYDDDIDLVRKIILKLAKGDERVLKDPEPKVYVDKHLDSGVQIVAWVWVEPEDYYGVYYMMQENVLKEFKKNGITIPYPHIQLVKE